MRGINKNAGFFSTKIPVIGQLEGVETTELEDINEEMHQWVYKEAKSATLAAISKAHAYFILIHPFGDGNGRVGRA
jgi:Fic family protein